MGRNEESLKIEESFKMSTAIVDLLGYSLVEGENVDYYILDSKEQQVGQMHLSRYKRNLLDYFRRMPKFGVYRVFIDNDIYGVYTDRLFDGAPNYYVKVKDNKNSIVFTLEDGTLRIMLYVPCEDINEDLNRRCPNLWVNDSSFIILSDNGKVTFDGKVYTASYIVDNEERIITVQEFRGGIKIEETIGNIPQEPKFIEGQTLTDYISVDPIGITLLGQYDCIYSQFPFTKTLKEVVGEDAFQSSGLSLLYEQIEKEKKISPEQKILILKNLVGKK